MALKTLPPETIDQQQRAEIEALQRRQHRDRMLKAIERGFTLSGVRLSDPATGGAGGCVVTLTPEEGKAVVASIKAVLTARK